MNHISEIPLLDRSVTDILYDLLNDLSDHELKQVVSKFGTISGMVDECSLSSWVQEQINNLSIKEELSGISLLRERLLVVIRDDLNTPIKLNQQANVIGLYPPVKHVNCYQMFVGQYRLESFIAETTEKSVNCIICDASGYLAVELKVKEILPENGKIYRLKGVKELDHISVEIV